MGVGLIYCPQKGGMPQLLEMWWYEEVEPPTRTVKIKHATPGNPRQGSMLLRLHADETSSDALSKSDNKFNELEVVQAVRMSDAPQGIQEPTVEAMPVTRKLCLEDSSTIQDFLSNFGMAKPSKRVYEGIWHILGPSRGYYIMTLGPIYINIP